MEEDSERNLEKELEKHPLVEMHDIMEKVNEGDEYLRSKIAKLNEKIQEDKEKDSDYKRGK